MATLWNQSDSQLTTTTWDRSWRCEEFTDLRTDFKIVVHMERVTSDANKVLTSKEPLPTIIRSLSQVQNDPDVIAYMTLKQKLIKKWLDEDTASATPQP